MNDYNQLKKNDIVYIVEPQTIILEGGYEHLTKPFQKAVVFNVWEKDNINIDITIYNGVYCIPFPKNETTNLKLITENEYKKMKMTESKIWKSVQKNLSNIDLLENPSNEMIQLKTLILSSLKGDI